MRFHVELTERSYDVVVDDGARHGLKALLDERAPRSSALAIITTAMIVDQAWFDLDGGRAQHVVLVPDGEAAKSLDALATLLEQLAALRLSRHDVIVAVGGGALTDVAGFAAAVYLRGVDLVSIPTSLVGQVDAAIGGKTGVNLAAGKNLVGAFHQPLGVLCDTSVLSTLAERDRRSGLGEVAKCWLIEGRPARALAAVSNEQLIELSVGLKVSVVSDDEREAGVRAVLNYGHTLAHALEKLSLPTSPTALLHGEAVAIGLAYAARLARALGRVGDDVVANHDEVLDFFGLGRTLDPTCDVDALVEAMRQDKKAHHDLSFVLPGPDGFTLVRDVDATVVADELRRFQGAT